MWRIFLASIVVLITCSGCVGHLFMNRDNINAIEKQTAKEILTNDHDADIFQYNGLIYTSSSSHTKELFEDVNLDKGKQISQIIRQSNDHNEFIDGVATKLPIGTEIYQVPGEGLAVLTVVIDGERIFYIAAIK